MMQRESLDPTTDLKISVEYLCERSTIILVLFDSYQSIPLLLLAFPSPPRVVSSTLLFFSPLRWAPARNKSHPAL